MRVQLTLTVSIVMVLVGLLLEGDFIEFDDWCSRQQMRYFGGLLLNKATVGTCLHVGFCLKERDEHRLARTAVLQPKEAFKPCLLSDRWHDRLVGNLIGFVHLSWLNMESCYACVHRCPPFLDSF